MRKLFNYFQLLFLSTSGILLLCVAFAINPELALGIFTGKICWFHFSALLFAISVLFMELTIRKSRYFLSLPDILLLLIGGFILFTYNPELNLQPEKQLFAAQLAVLWFMLRSALQIHRELRVFFITIIICTGTIASIWGLSYFYDRTATSHPVFKMMLELATPEIFAGYVAIILPVCLNTVLRFKDCNKYAWWDTRTFLFYFSGVTALLISLTLLTGTSQPAGLAAVISCIWVCWMRLIGWDKTKKYISKHHRLFAITSIFLISMLTGLALLGSITKAEAGSRRLLIWNVTTKAIMEHPVSGTGMGGFPVAYARTQAAYFGSDNASEKEIQNAICPAYANNEYLHIGLEFGITGLLLFMLWLAFSLYYGIKHRQIGTSGGIVSLAVFAMYSYPLQLPSFWILLIFFAVICVTDPKQRPLIKQRNIPYVGLTAAIASCLLFFEQKNSYQIYKEWKAIQVLRHDPDYNQLAPRYTHLFPELKHQVDFLLEGAGYFRQTGEYETAISWLKYALQLSAHADIYYELAMNEEALGRYENAEFYLEEISRILPAKGYTFYMLAQLYAEPDFHQHEKLLSAANKVLYLQYSRHSGVTDRMKNEIYRLLEKTEK